MIGGKKIIPIFIVLILLSILLSTCISAEETLSKNQKMTIWMPKVTHDDYFSQIQVSQEDLQIFTINLYNILDTINP